MNTMSHSPSRSAIDLAEAQRFLTLLDDSAETFTFQTFSDGTGAPGAPRTMHGALAGLADTLTSLNDAGSAVCVTVNETDGKGRKAANVTHIRAVFADFDGTPLPSEWPLEPHIVVESSSGHWHAYWLVDGLPLKEFAPIMRLIAAKFGTDANVCDLARVMRLPGFVHRKGAPFRSRIIHESGAQPYGADPIRAAFAPALAALPAKSAPTREAVEHITAAQLSDLRSALFSLSADDRAAWVANGHRLKALGDLGRALWIEWSQTSQQWQSDDEDKWETFKPERTGYRAIFAEAQRNGWRNPATGNRTHVAGAPNESAAADVDADDLPRLPAPTVSDEMYYGLVGDVMRAASNGTEVHPAAAGLAFMSFAGIALGRECCIRVGDDRHHPRLFTVHVGRSSIAGKGMALTLVRRIRKECARRECLMGTICGNFHDGGLSSREGLAWLIRDASDEVGKDGVTKDPGVLDKRLFVVEEEFANVLKQSQRDGNTLSAAIRTAWDGHDLAPATKNNRTRASRPHIGIHACITPYELETALNDRELTNGFANRFLYCWAERQGVVPYPQPTPEEVVSRLARPLAEAIQHAKSGGIIEPTDGARVRFARFYQNHRRGLGYSAAVRGLIERLPPYAWRLALIFALLEKSRMIRGAHMDAALAWLAYCTESTKLIFSTAHKEAEASKASSMAARIVQMLDAAPNQCLDREPLRVALGKPAKKLLDAALEQLDMAGAVEEITTPRESGGRASRTYQLKPSARDGRVARLGPTTHFPPGRASQRIDATWPTGSGAVVESPQTAAIRAPSEAVARSQTAQCAQVAGHT